MKRSFFERYSRFIMIAVIVCFPIAVFGAVQALRSNRNDVQEWLPEHFPETRDYKDFQQHFKNETFVLASWDGCTLEDERLDRLAARLSPGTSESQPESRYFRKVLTGRSLLDELTLPPIGLPVDEALNRLERSVIGKDHVYTCAILTLSDEGKENLHPTIDAIYSVAEACSVPRSSIRLGGPPMDNVSIDLEGERMLLKLMLLSGVVGLTLSWWYLRDIRLTLMVFMGGVYSAALCLALVRFSGGVMNSILLTMPSVVYTAGLACAIHMVNYYRHERSQHGPVRAAERGLKAAWLPCALSAGTTGLGLISLATSELVPIRNFGIYSSIGVMATIVLMYLYLPSALYLWPPAERAVGAHDSSLLDPDNRRRMRWLAQRIIARPILIWAIFIGLMLYCGSGLYWARTTVNLMSLFAPDAEVIQSYRWLEDKLGPLVPMEVVVRMREPNLTFVERIELITELEERIVQIDEVGSTMSAATFAPEIPPARGKGRGGPFDRRRLFNTRLMENRDKFEDYYAEDDATGEELWRINVRVAALKDIDYGEFIDHIKARVEPVIERYAQEGAKGISGVIYTGLTPVVYRAERVLLNGLIESFFGAFLMIGIVMSIVFRDVRAGFYTMLPNVWPVAVVFGSMGWLGIVLDIGTMMTASVAMGVCVDDTVHFANWFRRATRLGLDHKAAAVMAFENSAGAIYQSTVIVALGLVTFALSSFMPTKRFGYLMCTLLFFGLVADLVFSPAMLAGRIGRYFTVGCRKRERKEDELEAARSADSTPP